MLGILARFSRHVHRPALAALAISALVLPALPLAIVLASFLPYKGPLTIGFVLIITGWSWGARVLRAQTLSMRNREFVTAAKSTGEPTWRIVFYEIFPGVIAVVVAQLLGTIIYAILAEAGLEYLGLGDLRGVSWGTMLYWAGNQDALKTFGIAAEVEEAGSEIVHGMKDRIIAILEIRRGREICEGLTEDRRVRFCDARLFGDYDRVQVSIESAEAQLVVLLTCQVVGHDADAYVRLQGAQQRRRVLIQLGRRRVRASRVGRGGAAPAPPLQQLAAKV
jgi:hypothetical protein